MSRNVSGTYSLPGAVNPVADGDTITANWANTTLNDIATALTNSLDRTGNGVMTAQLKAADGTVGAPGISFGTDLDSGFYAVAANQVGLAVNGANVLTVAATTFTLASTCFPVFAGVPTAGSHLVNKTYTDATYQPLSGNAALLKGNWTLIKEVAITAVATIDFINGVSSVVMDSTYAEYGFEFENMQGPNEALWMRTTSNASTFDSAASDYEHATWTLVSSASPAWSLAGSTGDTKIVLALLLNSGTTPANGWVSVFNPAVAGSVTVRSQFTSDYANSKICDAVGMRVSGDVDGVRFLWGSGGNFGAAGYIRMYGRRKA
jgi:hypothetical protein